MEALAFIGVIAILALVVRLWMACNTIDELYRRIERVEEKTRDIRDDLHDLRLRAASEWGSGDESRENNTTLGKINAQQ